MTQMSPSASAEDLTIRNLSSETQRSYVHHVAKFSRFFGRSPDKLGYEEVRAYQAHLMNLRVSWEALNQTVCTLRLFYGVTLGRSDLPERRRDPMGSE
ncbi:phage integrase N-terminal SAM-like domain-containing protein [Mesorhizobium sp. M0895]|uniref:phage integrase N-terminal SAM-like domain-containing protein n=1 Tax=Mesorhizobium sp. M0895 TaxID=2957019 RepID=UPI00333DF5F3